MRVILKWIVKIVHWIILDDLKGQWWAFVKTTMKLRVS